MMTDVYNNNLFLDIKHSLTLRPKDEYNMSCGVASPSLNATNKHLKGHPKNNNNRKLVLH